MKPFTTPAEPDLRRLRESVTRFCIGAALFNLVVFALPLIAFFAR